jgi:hypothetical protein
MNSSITHDSIRSLIHLKCHPKSFHGDIKYLATLNVIFIRVASEVGRRATNMEARPPFPCTRAARFLLRAAAVSWDSSIEAEIHRLRSLLGSYRTDLVRSQRSTHGSHEPLGRNVERVPNRHAKVSSLFPLIQPLGNPSRTPTWRLTLGSLPHKTLLPLSRNPTPNSTASPTLSIVTTVHLLRVSVQVSCSISLKLCRLCLQSILLGITHVCDGLKVSWEKVGVLSRCSQATPIVCEVEIEFAVAFDVVVVAGLEYSGTSDGFTFCSGSRQKTLSHLLCFYVEGDVKCGKRMHQNVFWIWCNVRCSCHVNFRALSVSAQPSKFSQFQVWGDENDEPIEDSNVGEGTSDSFRLLLQCWTICFINVVDVFLNSLCIIKTFRLGKVHLQCSVGCAWASVAGCYHYRPFCNSRYYVPYPICRKIL